MTIWTSAAILDFVKFHFWAQSHAWGAEASEAKLGIKFDDNRMYTSGVIQLCMKIQDGVDGRLVFRISEFLA